MKRQSLQSKPRPNEAFSLLEVMIAAGIFFMAIFAILALVSTNIRNARLLQETPDAEKAAMVLADVVQTNKLEEGSYPYDISDAFPGYQCNYEITEVASNGLFKIECVIAKNHSGANSETHVSTLCYRPESQRGGMFK